MLYNNRNEIKNPDAALAGRIGGKHNQAFTRSRLSNLILARAAIESDSAMIRSACDHYETRKNGKDHLGNPRIRCCLCGKSWIVKSPRPLGDMRIPKDKAVMALRMMLEGASVRTINRLTGLNLRTLLRLLLLVGERCQKFLDARIRNIPARDIQCDEIWSYVGCHERYLSKLHGPEKGDCYVFLAIDRDSKLILTYELGKRTLGTTRLFASKLRDAITGNCQITTDGFTPYQTAMPVALWDRHIDYATIVKIFGAEQHSREGRYSTPQIKGQIKKKIWGNPNPDKISTSHCERFNLSLRMGLRRFTRLTNAFSKSFRHHHAAIALWLTAYNYCRPHMTLKTTPAVKAGLADSTWTVERLLHELAGL